MAELNITKIIKYTRENKKYEEVVKFPAVERDYSNNSKRRNRSREHQKKL